MGKSESVPAATGEKDRISIVIPALNAGKYLRRQIESIRSQKTGSTVEILLIDSSSEDDTLSVARSLGLRTQMIARQSFSHPGTRNLGVRSAEGEFIVFLTQDALPADSHWLDELVQPLRRIPDLAASYSRQIPRPGAGSLESRDISLGAPGVDEVRACDSSSPEGKKRFSDNLWHNIRFSNVSACYRRRLLAEYPFDERLPMVEDQEWAKRMLEKNWRIFYASKSLVRHSHNFGFGETYRRFKSYGASYSKFMPVPAPSLSRCLQGTARDFFSDAAFILKERRTPASRILWLLSSPALRFAKHFGFYRGWRNG